MAGVRCSSVAVAHPADHPSQPGLTKRCVVTFHPAPIKQVKCITGNQRHDWAPEVTHVVSQAPRRNQKCLAAMAAGAWLVGPGWVDACAAAGALVPEASEHFGGGEAVLALPLLCLWRVLLPLPFCLPALATCAQQCAASPPASLPARQQEPSELGGGSADLEKGAAAHWRRRAAATGQGAFEGLRVLVAPALEAPFRREDIA